MAADDFGFHSVRRSDEEAFGHADGELGPHGLYAVHDLALVAEQDDAQAGQVGVRQPRHGVQRGDAGLLEVVDVARQFQRRQPLVDRLELQHVGRFRTQRFHVPVAVGKKKDPLASSKRRSKMPSESDPSPPERTGPEKKKNVPAARRTSRPHTSRQRFYSFWLHLRTTVCLQEKERQRQRERDRDRVGWSGWV